MSPNEMFLILASAGVIIVLAVVILLKLASLKKQIEGREDQKAMEVLAEKTKAELLSQIRSSRQETTESIRGSMQTLGELLASGQKQTGEQQDKRLAELNQQLGLRIGELNQQLTQKNETLQKTVTEQLTQIDHTMERRLLTIQEGNEKKLDEMRATVDEKLQKTLEDRIGQSFKLVSERLEEVYKGLGEMQNLAAGVGDLKKVLSNVKTRGILGEYQLGAILEQILSPEQYSENVVTKVGSSERVEYAVRLPGDEGGKVYLPIDAKFPADAYSKLNEAYEEGEPAGVDTAAKNLVTVLKSFAKDIRDKYIDPPNTTDFAIMFLPFEGLYAEAVRRGLVETLQREYKVNIAGPTTMAALLNSLQMGFKTLAIQKHSSEVWRVLGAVKTEFDKFGDTLASAQQKINLANKDLDRLVGVRTRQIQRKLKDVTEMPETDSNTLLDLDQFIAEEGPEGESE